MHNDFQHGVQISITHTHARTEHIAVVTSPLSPSCPLPLVSFYRDKNKTDRIFSSLELSPVDEPVTWMRLVILLNLIQSSALMTKL